MESHAGSLALLAAAVDSGDRSSSVATALGNGHVVAHNGGVIAETLLLGDDLLLWLMLALGGALFAGNVMALVRPPAQPRNDADLVEAPRSRSILMAAIGFVVGIAALAALVAK